MSKNLQQIVTGCLRKHGGGYVCRNEPDQIFLTRSVNNSHYVGAAEMHPLSDIPSRDFDFFLMHRSKENPRSFGIVTAF